MLSSLISCFTLKVCFLLWSVLVLFPVCAFPDSLIILTCLSDVQLRLIPHLFPIFLIAPCVHIVQSVLFPWLPSVCKRFFVVSSSVFPTSRVCSSVFPFDIKCLCKFVAIASCNWVQPFLPNSQVLTFPSCVILVFFGLCLTFNIIFSQIA